MGRKKAVEIPSYRATREMAKSVARLFNEGHEPKEIVALLPVSLTTVYRLLPAGQELLRMELRNKADA